MKYSLLQALAFSLLLLTGCAVARKMSFDNVRTSQQVPAPGKPCLISVIDQREQVRSGKRKPTWSGSLLSTVQIPYPVNTATGKPLADEFALVLRNSIDPNGQATSITTAQPFKDSALFFGALVGKPDTRVLVMYIGQWDPSSMPRLIDIKYYCDYELSLEVYDAQGKLMASASAKDHWERIETDLAGTVNKLQRLSGGLLEQQLTGLLNNADIRNALQ